MPHLIEGVHHGFTGEPIVWYCSDCLEAFRPPHMNYTDDDLRDVDRRFREHCGKAHPGASVISREIAETNQTRGE